MSYVPEGAQLSEDGRWWWDGNAWQLVEEAWAAIEEKAVEAWDWATGGEETGQRVCGLGPCPSCAENDQVSSPCVYGPDHGDEHECAYGDTWEQTDGSAEALALGTPVATASLTYDESRGMIGVAGNTTGWPRGTITVVGQIYRDNQLVETLETTCRNSTACTLPSWSTEPDPGTHWELVVTGSGPRYGDVEDTDTVDVP